MSSMFAACELIGPFLESAGLLGGMADNHYTSAVQNSTLFASDHMRMEVFGGDPHENSVSPKTVLSRRERIGLAPGETVHPPRDCLITEISVSSPRKPESPQQPINCTDKFPWGESCGSADALLCALGSVVDFGSTSGLGK